MEATVGTVAILAGAVATLAVAGFVLFLDFRLPVHRAFALLLVLRAMLDVLFLFSERALDYAGRLRVYWYIAIPFAAIHFALVYRRRHSRPASARRGTRAWTALIVGAALAVEALYVLDHTLFKTAGGSGPLVAFVFLAPPTYAAIALVFATGDGSSPRSANANALLAAAFGFSLQPLFYSTFRIVDLALDITQGTTQRFTAPLQVMETTAYALAFLLVAFVAWLSVQRLRRGGRARLARILVVAWAGVALAACAVAASFLALDGRLAEDLLVVANATCALALPVSVAYALIRHRLFDAEVRLRFAIKGTTLAAIFLAVFFVVNKITENVVADRFGGGDLGIYVGGAVAGLLLFALAPLQSVADRLARKAVPSRSLAHLSRDDRLHIYREQLEAAWHDGHLTSKERMLFVRLQERLGVSADEAAQLETEVLSALAKPAKTRKPAAGRAAA